MSKKTVEDRLIKIIGEVLDVNRESIHPTSNFLDYLIVDKLDAIELDMRIEEEFGFDIDESSTSGLLEKYQTVQELADYIKTKMK